MDTASHMHWHKMALDGDRQSSTADCLVLGFSCGDWSSHGEGGGWKYSRGDWEVICSLTVPRPPHPQASKNIEPVSVSFQSLVEPFTPSPPVISTMSISESRWRARNMEDNRSSSTWPLLHVWGHDSFQESVPTGFLFICAQPEYSSCLSARHLSHSTPQSAAATDKTQNVLESARCFSFSSLICVQTLSLDMQYLLALGSREIVKLPGSCFRALFESLVYCTSLLIISSNCSPPHFFIILLFLFSTWCHTFFPCTNQKLQFPPQVSLRDMPVFFFLVLF